jgi:hypothetical protein
VRKSLTHEVALWIQARNGASLIVVVWAAVSVVALLAAFAFLCVSCYDWLSVSLGDVFAGLVMAGILVIIAVIAAAITALVRNRVRQRAIYARAHASPWVLDPNVLAAAIQIGRALGWRRIVPAFLLSFAAAQWAREYLDHRQRKP